MSLINEALKKAQKQRTGDTPPLTAMPSVGGESATRIARRAQPADFNTLLLRLALGLVSLSIVAVGAIYLLRSQPSEPAASPPLPNATASAPASAPAPNVASSSAPATATISAPAPLPPTSTPTPEKPADAAANDSAPVAAFVIPGNPPAATTATPAPVVTPPPAVAPAPISVTVEPPKAAAPPPKMEPRAITFVEGVRVAGIRVSATDSKVLMNDRVYRIGDTVEHEMGIRLVGITGSALTFEDENGGRYTRSF